MSLTKRLEHLEKTRERMLHKSLVIVKGQDEDTIGYASKGKTWLLDGFDNDLDLLLEQVERTAKTPVVVLNPIGQNHDGESDL